MTKNDLKIVFLGTPDFAVESLRRLVDGGYNVAAVITMPDKPAGRGHKLIQSPVKQYALAHGLPVLQPANLKDPDFISELRAIAADLFIVIAFRMLPRQVWQMPPLGTFNLHASLLPRFRGAAPINWAVINGDSRTGVTTFMLKHEIDTGDILRREEISIGPDENVGSVHDRLMRLGADLTIDTVDHIIAGDLRPIPQSEFESDVEPAPAPKIFRDTCRIEWNSPATKIHNLVRGLSPYPAAWTLLSDGNGNADPLAVKIFATALTGKTDKRLAPGYTKILDNRLFVAARDGALLEILELQPAGKKRMAASEFLRGHRSDNFHFINLSPE